MNNSLIYYQFAITFYRTEVVRWTRTCGEFLKHFYHFYLSPRDIETTRDKIMDSVIRNEKGRKRER